MPISIPPPYKNALRDDGTETGILRTENFGGLVPVAFRRSWCSPTNFVPTVGLGVGAAPEGACIRWTGSVDSSWNQASIRFGFRGTKLGILWDGSDAANAFYRDFSVIVDGVAFPIIRQPVPAWDYVGLVKSSGLTATLVTTNLPDTFHIAEIGLAGDPAKTATNRTTVYAMLVEERAGYSRPAGNVGCMIVDSSFVPATRTQINYTSGVISMAPRAARGVMYYNTDSAQHTVTVYAGTTPIWSAVLAAVGSAGNSATCDLLGLTAWDFEGNQTLAHAADVAGKVQPTYLLGGF